MNIERAELMHTGKLGDRDVEFTLSDLQGIADSFLALQLSGRVPLKFGHNDDQPVTDGQPALGWVNRVWIEGKSLLADLTDLPKVVYDAIKKGLYKFVSVELLRDVQAGTRRLPWVLDAVALLGADQPAFGNLRDLQALTLSRSRLPFSERVLFTRDTKLEGSSMNTVDSLQTEIINMKFNHAIQSGRIEPNQREAFFRRFGRLSVEEQLTEVDSWISSAPKALRRQGSRTMADTPIAAASDWTDPSAELTRRAREVQSQHLVKFSRDVSLIDAMKQVIRNPENKELIDAYWTCETR